MKLPSFMKIPTLILQRIYNVGSLENTDDRVTFTIKNRLSDASLIGIGEIRFDGRPIDPSAIRLELKNESFAASDISADQPIDFPVGKIVHLTIAHPPLSEGKHEIDLNFMTKPFGTLSFSVHDSIVTHKVKKPQIPYDKEENFSHQIIAERQAFIEEYRGLKIEHINHYSFEPTLTEGNVENFTGVAQIPLGFAGPLTVNGEHAQGEFIVPLATTEGTLVASYNRGMKVLNLSGGVTCTVQDDCMQRAPVFVFDNARGARDFRDWVNGNMDGIRQAGEETSSVAKLLYVDTFLSNHFAFLRFNFATGDAAGQNMVGRATFAACSWILENNSTPTRFFLESNLATDKKASQVNIMRTRGKRVTAEVTVPRDVLIQHMRVEPESLAYHAGIANIGAILSGANNNGLHSANGITAMFIATGQDVANVAESSAGIIYVELTPERDLHISLTIPSLIVATYGGGTSLPTQRESLEILDCYGKGKVRKFAEIIAGVCLAGEISLASAISSLDWVSSHEAYGRNR